MTPATSHTKPGPTILSLRSYISNIFYGVFINDDDDIALQVYDKNWSRDVQEVNNGASLNFQQFREFLITTRASLSDRYLVSQSAVVAPADDKGLAGQVAHTSHWTAVSGGKKIKGTIVSVLKIVVVEGRRQVLTESFVLSTEGV